MIMRTWRGSTKEEDAERYLEYLQETGLREYRETDGNRGALALKRTLGDGRIEFLTVSFWQDMEAIRAFAGPDPEFAVFYPEDEDYLVDADPDVCHYELGYAYWPVDLFERGFPDGV